MNCVLGWAWSGHVELTDTIDDDSYNKKKPKIMEALLKEWRHDAMDKHQYESAIFIGDKLLALTSEQDYGIQAERSI